MDETMSIRWWLSRLVFLQDRHRKDRLAEELVISRDEVEKLFDFSIRSLSGLQKSGVEAEDEVRVVEDIAWVPPEGPGFPVGWSQLDGVVCEHFGGVNGYVLRDMQQKGEQEKQERVDSFYITGEGILPTPVIVPSEWQASLTWTYTPNLFKKCSQPMLPTPSPWRLLTDRVVRSTVEN
ncbi:hypothetical protein PV08_11291 [Exophiala spinifera]|uniref:Uncharacterized protein n=1 Tax=Exophiala spinifera TaxID=91928 RepID=A0A0D2BG34_9EURO|nr:uncharacterized protein PV08_11291 [Exophiala spinifera]KIW10329.1 hypothetical protein PV08_11291 [Exophiala spinifera]